MFRRNGTQRLPVRNPAPLATPQALYQSFYIDILSYCFFYHDTYINTRTPAWCFHGEGNAGITNSKKINPVYGYNYTML